MFACPVSSCKRHRHAFARKDNLAEHLKRVHHRAGQLSMNRDAPAADTEDGYSPIGSVEESVMGEEDDDDDEFEDDGEEVASSTRLDKASLIAKLRELEGRKAKCDGDIAALKRVLAIM
ncbi:hypothetical protein G7Y89_g2175 [Cudoniella acicularis]|uniref:C2H2-type domain-containing protein n=1 Tax=Cudoniella acicularis TaxID=354080 RepID=A0A8H4RUM0_9HELO|nr:hypothetical protein G7Y89_g2175 [Cudoniella acicularis]